MVILLGILIIIGCVVIVASAVKIIARWILPKETYSAIGREVKAALSFLGKLATLATAALICWFVWFVFIQH